MTFKLFNKLNELFKEHKKVCLRDYPLDSKSFSKNDGTIGTYDENTDIMEIELDLKTYRYASLYVIDGDSFYKIDRGE